MPDDNSVIVHGDGPMAGRVDQIMSQMTEFWLSVYESLGTVDLDGWTGATGEAARTKLADLRTLVLSHVEAHRQAASGHRQLAETIRNEHEDMNRTLADVPVSDITVPGAAAGIAVQATGTCLLAWASAGLVIRASVEAYDAVNLSMRLRLDASRAVRNSVSTVLAFGVFAGGAYVTGLVSALMFEGTAVGVTNALESGAGVGPSGKRVAILAAAFTGAEIAGFAAGQIALEGVGLTEQNAALIGGALGGIVGGLAGPTFIDLQPGQSVNWALWLESAVLATVSGTMAGFLTRLRTAASLIAAARQQLPR